MNGLMNEFNSSNKLTITAIINVPSFPANLPNQIESSNQAINSIDSIDYM